MASLKIDCKIVAATPAPAATHADAADAVVGAFLLLLLLLLPVPLDPDPF